MAKEKPPILGMIQRSGEVVLNMLANVQQKTIAPFIKATIAKGTTVFTDEYDIYSKLTEWGFTHRTVNHSKRSTPVTRMAMDFTKSTSTQWKVFGLCCAPG